MNLLALQPIMNIEGHSSLLSWLLSLVIIAVVVYFVVWLVTKFAGPPNIPEPAKWIVWAVVGIALLIFIFAALGIAI